MATNTPAMITAAVATEMPIHFQALDRAIIIMRGVTMVRPSGVLVASFAA
jgi:hypothetical protein